MRWHYCRHCDRIQRFRSKCSSCDGRCEEVDVPRHPVQTFTPLLAIPLLVLGIVGFLSRSFIHGKVDGSDVCCTVIILLYFVLLAGYFVFSIFSNFIYQKWTRDVAREMVEDGVVIRVGRREEVYSSEEEDEYEAPKRTKRRRRPPRGEATERRESRERPPKREALERPSGRRRSGRGGRSRRRRPGYRDDEDDWDLDDEWLY